MKRSKYFKQLAHGLIFLVYMLLIFHGTCTEPLALDGLSSVYSPGFSNDLKLRAGYASVFGSNGPFPVHVCLNQEMGLTGGFFYGIGTRCSMDSGQFGVILGVDLTQFSFRGSGEVFGEPGFTSGTPEYPTLKGDKISGDLVSTIICVSADIATGVFKTSSFRLFPRIEAVEYQKNIWLENHTRPRNWSLEEKARYRMVGIGGSVEIDSQSFSEVFGMNFETPKIRGSVSAGQSTIGASYLSCEGSVMFAPSLLGYIPFFQSDAKSIEQRFLINAGIGFWRFFEPVVDNTPSLSLDTGSISSFLFFLDGKLYF